MIEETDRRLKEWVESLLKGFEVSFDPPGNHGQGKSKVIGLYLLEVVQVPPPRETKKLPPLQVALRYLVTASASTTAETHRALGELVFAAMEKEGVEVEHEAPSIDVWKALGVLPRPSFLLRTMLIKERVQPQEHFVRSPVVIESAPAVPLYGVVVGPGEIPLMGAGVECPALRLYTRTDSKGRFRFSMVPSAPPPALVVTAKGKKLSVTADLKSLSGEPLRIQFTDLER